MMENFDLKMFLDPCGRGEMLDSPFMPRATTIGANLEEEDYQVAIIGVDYENDKFNVGVGKASDSIRKHLYRLAHDFKNIKIADIGNLKVGDTSAAVFYALSSVVTYLLEKKVVPIILGGSQDLTVAVYEAIKEKKGEQRITVIDSKIDLMDDAEELSAHNYMFKLLNNPAVSELNVLGIQRYYCPNWQMDSLRDSDAFGVRLNEVVSSIPALEPLFRDSDHFSFDLSAIRQSDMPARKEPIPNGLNGVEACHLAQLAGLSDSILLYGIYGLNPSMDKDECGAALAAEIVWHIFSGIDNRFGDYPMRSLEEYDRYVVVPEMEGDEEIVFFNNRSNGRWWVEIPTMSGKKVFACTKADYKECCAHSIPNVWMRHYMR